MGNESKSHDKLPIFERSVASSVKMFGQQQVDSGIISPEQFSLITNMRKILTKDYTSKPIYVYLHLSPEQAMTRCLKRGRPEEMTLSLEYFKDLHKVLDNWMKNEQAHVFKIDANHSSEHILAVVERIIKLFT